LRFNRIEQDVDAGEARRQESAGKTKSGKANLEPQRTQRNAEENPAKVVLCHRFARMNADFKTHPSENPAGRGRPLGWGTLKFRYAARSLEPPLGRFCKHRKQRRPKGRETAKATRRRTTEDAEERRGKSRRAGLKSCSATDFHG
jgi:hypothetical protein